MTLVPIITHPIRQRSGIAAHLCRRFFFVSLSLRFAPVGELSAFRRSLWCRWYRSRTFHPAEGGVTARDLRHGRRRGSFNDDGSLSLPNRPWRTRCQ